VCGRLLGVQSAPWSAPACGRFSVFPGVGARSVPLRDVKRTSSRLHSLWPRQPLRRDNGRGDENIGYAAGLRASRSTESWPIRGARGSRTTTSTTSAASA
jgi:hypothetical protein